MTWRAPGPVGSLLAVGLLAAACAPDPTVRLPGTLEWDRNSVLAEASEPVVEWFVAEGDRVAAGAELLRLDGARHDARIAAVAGRLEEAEARLDELEAGPRQETIDRARAELASAEASVREAELAYAREAELRERDLTSEARIEQALAARDQRRAAARAAAAALEELLAGTRREQLEQALARVGAIRAELEGLELTRRRLTVTAPRAGRVDSLPFRPGDQPRTGDIVASLLVGEMPIARVFVPADRRAALAEGDRFRIRVEGFDRDFPARLRSIRSEASFTPYYALTGDDASRLVYRAELLITDDEAADLPAGLPLAATPVD